MAFRLDPLRSRMVLVAVWLAAALAVLVWQRPGFWRLPYPRFQHARALADAGLLPEAIGEARRALLDDPDNAGYAEFKGYLELRAGRPADAAASFEQALAMDGSRIEALLGLAEAELQRQAPARAAGVLARTPRQALTIGQRFRRQSLLAAAGQFDAALEDAGLLQDLAEVARQLEALRWAMTAGAWQQAIEISARLDTPDTAAAARHEALSGRAIALRAVGRDAEALATFERIAGPANLDARAQLCLSLERFACAAQLLEALTSDPDAPAERRAQLAWAFEQSGQAARAIDVHRRLLADEDDTDRRLQLVRLLNGLGRFDEAWRALDPLPRPAADPDVRRLQAATAAWAGRYDEAARIYGTFPRLDGDLRGAVSDLAWRLAERGDDRAAERLFRRLHQETPTADVLSRLLTFLNGARRYDEAWTLLRTTPATVTAQLPRDLRALTPFWAGAFQEALPLLGEHAAAADTTEAWAALAEAARRTSDGGQETRALTALLRLDPGRLDAATRRAQLLEQAGQVDDAVAAYATVFTRDPSRLGVARTLAFLEERRGRLNDAIGYYRRLVERGASPEPELFITLARLYRRVGMDADSAAWYQRALASRPDERPLAREAAWVYLVTSDVAAARAVAGRLTASAQPTAEDLVIATRAAELAADPAAAAMYLQRVADLRPLDATERAWLAGLYRAAGDTARARTAYEALLTGDSDALEVLEAVGDLRWASREFAGAETAYARARARRPDPGVVLKMARLRSVLGDYTTALADYHQYLRDRPSTGLLIELARVSLGAGVADEAEQWAREATMSDERGFAATAVLAEALHLRGRRDESLRLVSRLPPDLAGSPADVAAYARLQATRNRHVAAASLFERAIRQGADDPADLWLLASRSALRLGDLPRAASRLNRGIGAGLPMRLVDGTVSELAAGSRPQLALPLRLFGDNNGLSLGQAGGRALLRPGRVPIEGEFTGGFVAQDDVRYTRTRAAIDLPRLFITPALLVRALAGVEEYSAGHRLWIGDAAATMTFANAATVDLSWQRGSLWTGHDARDPRQFNRVTNLAALGPGFSVTALGARGDVPLAAARSLRVDARAERYADGNQRTSVYGHLQIPVTDRPGRWTALAPNAYIESYRDRAPFYFSPDRLTAVGLAAHTIATTPRWTLELELNPTLRWLDARLGAGAHGVADISYRRGPLTTGLGGFLFYDQRSRYLSWRLAAQVGVQVGR